MRVVGVQAGVCKASSTIVPVALVICIHILIMDPQRYIVGVRNAALWGGVQMAWEGWQTGPANVAMMGLTAIGTKRAIEADQGWVRATRARRADRTESVDVTKHWKYKKAKLLF